MRTLPEPDKLALELGNIRTLISGHDNIQLLLDMAADAADRRTEARDRSVRVAWRTVGAFGCLALIAFAIAGGAIATSMQPAPPPRVLVIDKANGVVQPLVSLASFQMDPVEATIRRNVNTFLLARESYSFDTAETNYYTAGAFMSPQLQAQWGQHWNEGNPESPLKKYRKERKLRVAVGAITLVRNEQGAIIAARASFTRTDLLNDLPNGEPTTWIANIPFHWVNPPTSERDRRINDLGWEVTDYTADRDLGAPSLPAPAPAVPAQGAPAPMALVAPGNRQQVTP
jgi:type IV secretion system protein VirB8